jgi:hypothetical protein
MRKHKNAREVGGKPQPLHDACAKKWFQGEKHREQGADYAP